MGILVKATDLTMAVKRANRVARRERAQLLFSAIVGSAHIGLAQRTFCQDDVGPRIYLESHRGVKLLRRLGYKVEVTGRYQPSYTVSWA